MGGTIFDIETFDGTGDYCLWKKKIKAIMMQLKVDVALDEKPEFPATMTSYEKSEIFKTTYSTLFLYLTDNMLRQVDGLETAAKIWKKLDELYMVKSLPNKICLLERFIGFKMDTSKTIDQNLDNFNETAIKYGRDSLTTSNVINAIKSKDFEAQIKKDKFMGSGSGESYYSRGRSPYKRNHSKNHKPQEVADAAIVSEESDFGDVLNVGTEKKVTNWIMDRGCTFHMCPNREWFQNFKECK
ncbi:hypothetical protein UlMin_022665 [Ulmus minor]